jgi:predicted aminopeptidase
MKKYSGHYLADLIIHELLHAAVYLKGQSQFNEELAEFVGTEGARLYMEKVRGTGGTALEDADTANAQADRAAYSVFIRGLTAELDELYKSGLPREEKLRKKEEVIKAAKAMFDESYEERFTTDNYRGFSELPVNNAYLELYRLYHEEDHYFKDIYERSGSDLAKFIEAAKTLKVKTQGGRNPKEELEKALGLR